MLARSLSQPNGVLLLRRPDHASRRPLVRASSEFPDDPALPALGAIRAMGLARAIPSLGLPDDPVELILRAYKPGARATFEARVASRRGSRSRRMRRERARKPRCTTPCMPPDSRANPGLACRRCSG